MTTKTKTKATSKTKTVTITVTDGAGVFNAEKYVNAVWHSLYNTPKATIVLTRPLTLAEHEAAEAEAHRLLEGRVEDGCPGVPSLDDAYDNGVVDVYELRDWGGDVQDDAAVWEKIANDLLAFRRANKLAEAA